VIAVVASTLLACAVCFDPADQAFSRALLGMSVFLSLLPLGMLGGGAWYVVRKVRALESHLPPHPDA